MMAARITRKEPNSVIDLPFKWVAAFVINDARCEIVVQSDTHNRPEQRYVSFTGTFEGAGQIVDRLRVVAEEVKAADVLEICDAWDALHLKTFADLSEQQRQYLASVQTSLVIVNGERYGSAAEFEDLDDADFSNADNVIDSRDVIKRIEELTGAFEAAGIDPAKLDPEAEDYDAQGLEEDDPAHERAEELRTLQALESAAEGYGDWSHGETLIRESYFRDYAEEVAEDIGAISRDAQWPLSHIDWEAAANALKSDYTEVTFDGVTYLLRS